MKDQQPTELNIQLSVWHKRQAAMLYHFTSLDYLKTLHKLVGDLLDGVIDPLLDLAKKQNRDQVLVSEVWGSRNTSANWAGSAWPFLKKLQDSLARDISFRISKNRFSVSDVNYCLRGVYEHSFDWTTAVEEQMLKLAFRTISEYAAQYDRTVEEHENRWTDFIFAYNYPAFSAVQQKIPKFVIRPDVEGKTGEIPPSTGVYICLSDPYAALQFAWKEFGGTELRVAQTFNDIGLAALSTVGRTDLWFNEQKMFGFATSKPYESHFRNEVYLDGEPYPSLAPAAVARSAFTTRSCKWALVAPIPDHFEELASLADPEATTEAITRRIVGGERCVVNGFYFTPSAPNSRRYFMEGDTTPKFASTYGDTYWQWDSDQAK